MFFNYPQSLISLECETSRREVIGKAFDKKKIIRIFASPVKAGIFI